MAEIEEGGIEDPNVSMAEPEEGGIEDPNVSMAELEEGQRQHPKGKTALKLYKAALSNDWKRAEKIYKKYSIKFAEVIVGRGETALHVAALAGHSDFVGKLIEKLKKNEIYLRMNSLNNERRNTVLHSVAMSGSVKTAKAIIKKDNLRSLTTIRGHGNFFPIDLAVSMRHKKMVRFLYEVTKYQLLLKKKKKPQADDLDDEFIDGTFLIRLIKADVYDVALDAAKQMLQHKGPRLMEEEALKELAQKPLNSLGFLDRRIYPLLYKSSMNKKSATELVQLLWNSLASDETKVYQLAICTDENLILKAAKCGNFEFLSILILTYPDFLLCKDHNDYTIFHHAILNRHVEIFKLIQLGSVRAIVTAFKDKEGNNMLHLAGKLAPPNRLNIVPGAALQLQLELSWFEEVKKVMDLSDVNEKNNSLKILLEEFKVLEKAIDEYDATDTDATPKATLLLFKKLKEVMEAKKVLSEEMFTDFERTMLLFEELKTVMKRHKLKKHAEWTEEYAMLLLLFKAIEKKMRQHQLSEEYTPHDVFMKEHKGLMEEGEKWLRDTANSCMIVTALITTIAFAAAITFPGGRTNDGYPQFLNKWLFKIFAIADSVSLVFSTTSLLSFLSIRTSRYTMDDFRQSLPTKLVIGLVALFVSVVAMMVAFAMSIFINFKNSDQILPIATAAISSLPLMLFIWEHWRLFVDVVYSTSTTFLLFNKRDPYLVMKKKTKEKKKKRKVDVEGKKEEKKG